MSAQTASTTPTAADADRFPPQIKYIIWNEACERFSYYGMTAILENYLNIRMKMGEDHATEINHLFGGTVYFMPLLGGWLADRWIGRYWTILSISLFYCLGHATLAAFEGNLTGLYVGLALLAIGAGGIKPCVSAFVGDQFRSDQEHLLPKIYGWFYWAINLGAAAAFFIIPTIKEHHGYSWAFGVPGIAMALATLAFWMGTKYYVRRPPVPEADRVPFFGIVFAALFAKKRGASGSFLDRASGRYSAQQIEWAKTVLGILAVFITIPMFWACYNQVYSTWILQANKLTPIVFFNGGFTLNGETMEGAGSVLVMIWVPVLTLLVYPWLERRGCKPTTLRRMSVGMVLAAVAFVLCGLLQYEMDQGQKLSVAWQLIPYTVLEAGEVMVSATALEFAFSQAPPQMKSIVMSFWLMTTAGGHYIIAAVTGLNSVYVHAKGASEFFFYAILMFLVSGVFIFIASRYRERAFTQSATA